MSKKIIAVCGKGGVGKTAFTTMLSTALVASGKAGKLLLIDADPAMGLPSTIGIKVEKTIGEVREAIIKAASSDAKEALAQVAKKIDYMIMEALTENENLALLAMGRSDSLGCYCSVNGILKNAIDVLSQKFDTILIDGEAGIEQINRQVMRRVNDLIILSDASHRGMQTVSFILDMVSRERGLNCDRVGLVVNRVRGEQAELTEAAKQLGVPLLGMVPDDNTVREYDFSGKPLALLPADSPAMHSVHNIVTKLFSPQLESVASPH
jgi:CO dehydrogenase maturation factor